jgi:hypothetical protein
LMEVGSPKFRWYELRKLFLELDCTSQLCCESYVIIPAAPPRRQFPCPHGSPSPTGGPSYAHSQRDATEQPPSPIPVPSSNLLPPLRRVHARTPPHAAPTSQSQWQSQSQSQRSLRLSGAGGRWFDRLPPSPASRPAI